jgi:hypothetical protein
MEGVNLNTNKSDTPNAQNRRRGESLPFFTNFSKRNQFVLKIWRGESEMARDIAGVCPSVRTQWT